MPVDRRAGTKGVGTGEGINSTPPTQAINPTPPTPPKSLCRGTRGGRGSAKKSQGRTRTRRTRTCAPPKIPTGMVCVCVCVRVCVCDCVVWCGRGGRANALVRARARIRNQVCGSAATARERAQGGRGREIEKIRMSARMHVPTQHVSAGMVEYDSASGHNLCLVGPELFFNHHTQVPPPTTHTHTQTSAAVCSKIFSTCLTAWA